MKPLLLGAASAAAIVSVAAVPTAPAHAITALHDQSARGFGRDAVGGRVAGAAVMRVTNLAGASAGSLRACMEAAGPRFCVPTVAGTIRLKTPILVNDSNLTVFGGMAPGRGLLVRMDDTVNANGGPLRILGLPTAYVHDVIIQHVRFAVGVPRLSGGTWNPRNGDAVLIENAEDILLDHVTAAWGVDENLNVHNKGRDITVQYSIVAEGLNNNSHSRGALLCSQDASHQCGRYSLHKNLIMSNSSRNPDLKSDDTGHAEITNNYVYNYRTVAMEFWPVGGEGLFANVENNVCDPGPMTLVTGAYCFEVDTSPPDTVEVYHTGNLFQGLSSNVPLTADQLNAPQYLPNLHGTLVAASNLWTHLRTRVGPYPTSRLAGFEAAWVAQVTNQTGPSAPLTKAGITWPTIAAAAAFTDSDADGCPDAQETTLGTDPNAADMLGDRDGDGYLSIEDCNDLLTATP
jgi:hypothetical protein